jgi:hypothetical protein
VLQSTATGTKRPSRAGRGLQYIGCWDRGLERAAHSPPEEIERVVDSGGR